MAQEQRSGSWPKPHRSVLRGRNTTKLASRSIVPVLADNFGSVAAGTLTDVFEFLRTRDFLHTRGA